MNRTKLRSMSQEQRDELRMKYIRILSHLYSELRSYTGEDATLESDVAVRKMQRMSKKYRRLYQEMELIELSNAGCYCDMTKGEIEYRFGIISPESEVLFDEEQHLRIIGAPSEQWNLDEG